MCGLRMRPGAGKLVPAKIRCKEARGGPCPFCHAPFRFECGYNEKDPVKEVYQSLYTIIKGPIAQRSAEFPLQALRTQNKRGAISEKASL